MKHNILVKFNKDIDYKKLLPEIEELFTGLRQINGIRDVLFKTNCIDRDNRYHLLIQIDMKKEILDIYDNSLIHKKWKQNYGSYIEKKAIFDFE